MQRCVEQNTERRISYDKERISDRVSNKDEEDKFLYNDLLNASYYYFLFNNLLNNDSNKIVSFLNELSKSTINVSDSMIMTGIKNYHDLLRYIDHLYKNFEPKEQVVIR